MEELQEGRTVNAEIELLKSDRNISKKILESERNLYAERLKGKWGEDIDMVLSGKKKVKLTFKEKVRYFFDNLLKKL